MCNVELDQFDGSQCENTDYVADKGHPLLGAFQLSLANDYKTPCQRAVRSPARRSTYPRGGASDSETPHLCQTSTDSSHRSNYGMCARMHIRGNHGRAPMAQPPKGVCKSFWVRGECSSSRKTARQRNSCKSAGCYKPCPSFPDGGARPRTRPATTVGLRRMGPVSTTRRQAALGADEATPRCTPEYIRIDSDNQPDQGTGREPADAESPPMVQTGMRGTTVK